MLLYLSFAKDIKIEIEIVLTRKANKIFFNYKNTWLCIFELREQPKLVSSWSQWWTIVLPLNQVHVPWESLARRQRGGRVLCCQSWLVHLFLGWPQRHFWECQDNSHNNSLTCTSYFNPKIDFCVLTLQCIQESANGTTVSNLIKISPAQQIWQTGTQPKQMHACSRLLGTLSNMPKNLSINLKILEFY